jgi:hypothetical protein
LASEAKARETQNEAYRQRIADASEAPALRATIASLTIQRDAAEALAREKGEVADAWFKNRNEALAILRDLVTMTQGYKDREMRSPHHAVSDHEALWLDTDALSDRARKLVATP